MMDTSIQQFVNTGGLLYFSGVSKGAMADVDKYLSEKERSKKQNDCRVTF